MGPSLAGVCPAPAASVHVSHCVPQVMLVHVLNQDSGLSQFSWHIDTTEGQECWQIFYTMVIAIEMGPNGTVQGMRVASHKPAAYERVGTAQVFPSNLWHSTIPGDAGGIKLGVFLGMWTRELYALQQAQGRTIDFSGWAGGKEVFQGFESTQ